MNKTSMTNAAPGRIYGLDGLRALAIIGVTLFHMFPYTIKGGYLGVSLFFVISGYLLAVTCERRRKNGTYRVTSYYLKRIKRIYPALIIVLVASAGAYFFLQRDVLNGIRPELCSIVFGYNNWWQIAQNADYFTRITNASPFTHMWFLAIEIQFYLIWPLIFMIFLRLSKAKGDRYGLLFLVILTVISAVLTPIIYRPDNDVTRLYYGTDTRMYALLLGVLLGCLSNARRLPHLPKKIGKVVSIPLVIAMIVVTVIAYILMDGQYAFTYRGGMLLMTLLFCVLLVFTIDRRVPVGKWLEAKPLVWIGEHSYEMYLWQYPVIFLFMAKEWDKPVIGPILEAVIIVLLAWWLHWLTGVILARKIPEQVFKQEFWKRIVLLAAVALTAFCLVFGVVGIATAQKEKFAEKEELQQRLEENQKQLEESQQNTSQTADASQNASATEQDNVEPIAQENLLYGDASLENGAEVSDIGVLMIGDSIMLDSSPQIKEELPDCYIDAVQSRQLVDSPEVARELINDGHLNKTVVISLGTNGPLVEEDVRAMLDVFDSDVSIFWVNLFGRTVLWEEEANQLLLDMAEEYPNLTIINWCDVIKPHVEEWLWGDREHPNPNGAKVLATLIREDIDVCMSKQGHAPTYPVQETTVSTNAGQDETVEATEDASDTSTESADETADTEAEAETSENIVVTMKDGKQVQSGTARLAGADESEAEEDSDE